MVCVLILLMTFGCQKDPDIKFIDISKTMAIERPGYQSQSDLTIRVAVASMISPREEVISWYIFACLKNQWIRTNS